MHDASRPIEVLPVPPRTEIRDFATDGLLRGWQWVRWADGHVSLTYSAARWLPDPPEIRARMQRFLSLPKELRS